MSDLLVLVVIVGAVVLAFTTAFLALYTRHPQARPHSQEREIPGDTPIGIDESPGEA